MDMDVRDRLAKPVINVTSRIWKFPLVHAELFMMTFKYITPTVS